MNNAPMGGSVFPTDRPNDPGFSDPSKALGRSGVTKTDCVFSFLSVTSLWSPWALWRAPYRARYSALVLVGEPGPPDITFCDTTPFLSPYKPLNCPGTTTITPHLDSALSCDVTHHREEPLGTVLLRSPAGDAMVTYLGCFSSQLRICPAICLCDCRNQLYGIVCYWNSLVCCLVLWQMWW